MRFIDNCIKSKVFEIRQSDGSGLKTMINKIIIAVSGGADSLALADLLWRSQKRFKLEICIAHFEHGLRGEASLEDAEFVREFAASRGLNCFVESGEVKKFASLKKLSIETAARELRYQFLESLRQQLHFDAIALAHHADDQAETILMRILRGTGSVGLSAMKLKSNHLLRPLLDFKKSELENYCHQRNLTPRIDVTNFETDASRNKIRLNLLPILREYNPAIIDTLCRLGLSSADESDFIKLEALKIFPTAVKTTEGAKIELSQSVVNCQHVAIQRALIRIFVEKSVGNIKDFGFVHFESIRRVINDNLIGVELPHKIRANLKHGWLKLINNA